MQDPPPVLAPGLEREEREQRLTLLSAEDVGFENLCNDFQTLPCCRAADGPEGSSPVAPLSPPPEHCPESAFTTTTTESFCPRRTQTPPPIVTSNSEAAEPCDPMPVPIEPEPPMATSNTEPADTRDAMPVPLEHTEGADARLEGHVSLDEPPRMSSSSAEDSEGAQRRLSTNSRSMSPSVQTLLSFATTPIGSVVLLYGAGDAATPKSPPPRSANPVPPLLPPATPTPMSAPEPGASDPSLTYAELLTARGPALYASSGQQPPRVLPAFGPTAPVARPPSNEGHRGEAAPRRFAGSSVPLTTASGTFFLPGRMSRLSRRRSEPQLQGQDRDASEAAPQMLSLLVVRGEQLANQGTFGFADPYIEVGVDDRPPVVCTETTHGARGPIVDAIQFQWHETLSVVVPGGARALRLYCYDRVPLQPDELIGIGSVAMDPQQHGTELWVDLDDVTTGAKKGRILVQVRWPHRDGETEGAAGPSGSAVCTARTSPTPSPPSATPRSRAVAPTEGCGPSAAAALLQCSAAAPLRGPTPEDAGQPALGTPLASRSVTEESAPLDPISADTGAAAATTADVHPRPSASEGSPSEPVCSTATPNSRPPSAADINNRKEGRPFMGFLVKKRKGGLCVKDIVPDGPAAQAGLQDGDLLLQVHPRTTHRAHVIDVEEMISSRISGTHFANNSNNNTIVRIRGLTTQQTSAKTRNKREIRGTWCVTQDRWAFS